MLSAQAILCHSLDYLRILERSGVHLPEASRRIVNGLIEYLGVQAEFSEECAGTHAASELLEAAKDAAA